MAESDSSQRAGRGGIAIFAAKAYFIVTGFAQQPLLPLAIGLSGYGALSRVLAIANVFNNVVITSCTQGVSRAVAQSRGKEPETLRRLFPAHAVLALCGAVLLLALAPVFAWFESAPHIRAPLFVMAALLGIYGVYAPLIGYLNGRGQFVKQAALDVTAATLRTVLLVGAGFFFVRRGMSGALGATVGAAIAALIVFLVAVSWVRKTFSTSTPNTTSTTTATAGADERTTEPTEQQRGKVANTTSTSTYLIRLLPIALSQLFTNALMQSDLTLVGRFLSIGSRSGCDLQASPNVVAVCLAAAEKNADEWVAVYRACQLFAFLPYQVLFSVTQVLFPMLAKAASTNDKTEVARLTSRGARLGMILCGLPACVILALPGSCISFAYGATVAERGESALRVLALGQMAFAMMSLGTTILVSLGKELQAMMLTLVATALVALACFLTVPNAAYGSAQLVATADAATVALTLAMAVAFVLVVRAAGAFIPAATFLRVGLVVLGAWTVGHVIPHAGKIMLMPISLGIVISYLGALFITRELKNEDARWFLGIFMRTRKK